MARTVAVIGVPTSAGAFAPGQEQAAAAREAGLLEALRGAGLEVDDRGDGEVWRWRPDREERRAQNLGKVVEIVAETASRVRAAAASGPRVGLLYFDTHADLNLPESVREGALDWMGMAHMLGVEGARPELVGAGGRTPLLEPEQVLLFGWGPEQATEFETAAIGRLGIETVPVDAVAADPEGAAARALALLEPRCDVVLVHFDVDVVDFTDTPLSENWGRNEGLPFATALRALTVLLASPKLAALTITELNPDHTEEGSEAIERLVAAVAGGLTA